MLSQRIPYVCQRLAVPKARQPDAGGNPPGRRKPLGGSKGVRVAAELSVVWNRARQIAAEQRSAGLRRRSVIRHRMDI
jgi:hypothetical protein